MAEANMTPEQVGADLKTRLEDELRKYETEVLMLEARMRETPSAAETLQGRLDVAKDNMIRVKRALAKPSTMADGGMARGKGNKMYQHNYATGGKVVDNLKAVPPSNPGLSKLPTPVRNKMGYMKKGGAVKGRA